jgi:hypothetical protein
MLDAPEHQQHFQHTGQQQQQQRAEDEQRKGKAYEALTPTAGRANSEVVMRMFVVELFQDVVSPKPRLVEGLIELPDNYTVCLRSRRPLMRCFQDKVFQVRQLCARFCVPLKRCSSCFRMRCNAPFWTCCTWC